jgi:hypothetical protein
LLDADVGVKLVHVDVAPGFLDLPMEIVQNLERPGEILLVLLAEGQQQGEGPLPCGPSELLPQSRLGLLDLVWRTLGMLVLEHAGVSVQNEIGDRLDQIALTRDLPFDLRNCLEDGLAELHVPAEESLR